MPCSNAHIHTSNTLSFPTSSNSSRTDPSRSMHKHDNYHCLSLRLFFSHWARCSVDGPNCSSVSLERFVLLVLWLKHGGDSAVVIDSIICGLTYVANVQERRCLTNEGCPTGHPVSSEQRTHPHTHTDRVICPLSLLHTHTQSATDRSARSSFRCAYILRACCHGRHVQSVPWGHY